MPKTKVVSIKNLLEPMFGVNEKVAPDIHATRSGEKVSAIVNYEVVEKTKNFVVLKIKYVHATEARRSF